MTNRSCKFKHRKDAWENENPESNMTDEELRFMFAMEDWKEENQKQFPRWSDVLGVLHSLGYRKPD